MSEQAPAAAPAVAAEASKQSPEPAQPTSHEDAPLAEGAGQEHPDEAPEHPDSAGAKAADAEHPDALADDAEQHAGAEGELHAEEHANEGDVVLGAEAEHPDQEGGVHAGGGASHACSECPLCMSSFHQRAQDAIQQTPTARAHFASQLAFELKRVLRI
jgi:hypothetical protein